MYLHKKIMCGVSAALSICSLSRQGPCFPIWLPSSTILSLSCVLPQCAYAHCDFTCPTQSGFCGFDGMVSCAPAKWWIWSKFSVYRCPTCKIQQASEWCHCFCKEGRGLTDLKTNNSKWGEGTPLRESGSYVAHFIREHKFQAYIFTLSLFVL